MKLSPAILAPVCLSFWYQLFFELIISSRCLGHISEQSKDPCPCGSYILFCTTSPSVPVIHTKFCVFALVSNYFRYIIFVLQIDGQLLKDQGPQ